MHGSKKLYSDNNIFPKQLQQTVIYWIVPVQFSFHRGRTNAWPLARENHGNLYTMSQKSFRYLIFYNLNKPEPVFTIFGIQHPDNTSF